MRLTTSRQELVHRGALLLEDALRTASLPEDGRVLFVRSLSLGTVSARTSRTDVTRRVETGVGDLLARAVHGLDPSAPGSDAVYFRDAVESYASLAAYVATQRPTDAWFWQLVDPRWRPSLSRDESLRALLRSALDTPAGVVAAAEVVRQVGRRGALDTLLSALRWQDGPTLLAACGWSAAVADTSSDIGASPRSTHAAARSLSSSAVRALAQWVRRWGASDARSSWLAGVLLVSERPIRAVDSALPAALRALVVDVAREVPHESVERSGVPGANGDVDASTKETLASRVAPMESTDEPISMEDARSRRPSSVERTSPREERATTIGEPVSPDAPRDAPTREPSERSNGAVHGADELHAPPFPATHRARDDKARPADEPDGELESPVDDGAAGEVNTTRPSSRGDSSDVATAAPLPVEAAHDDASLRADVDRAQRTLHAMDDEHPTAYGGYFYLIPLLTRLHMSGFLDAHPALVDWDLPARLLARLDRRLGLDERDAALSILPRHPAGEPPGWDGVMSIPEAWAPFAAAAGRGPGRPQRTGAELVLASWVVVMRRWCHAHARMGLRALVSRPAHVASTRTHIDVYFTLSQVDMRVRLAGLDVNPGWVPWLGRVVQFHYRPTGGRGGE